MYSGCQKVCTVVKKNVLGAFFVDSRKTQQGRAGVEWGFGKTMPRNRGEGGGAAEQVAAMTVVAVVQYTGDNLNTKYKLYKKN